MIFPSPLQCTPIYSYQETSSASDCKLLLLAQTPRGMSPCLAAFLLSLSSQRVQV